MLAIFTPTTKGAIPNPPGPLEYVLATIGQPETVDPAKAYDTASCELIYQVYETLIDFKGSSTSEIVPELAINWTISPDGTTYTFYLRSGVKWQNPIYGTVKASDVEYSLQRVMVRDFTGGPAWMLWEPIFGNFSADLDNPVACGQKIDAAITSNNAVGRVTIQFATGVPYPPFMAILAQTWASVMSRNWTVIQGDWSGGGLNDGSWVAWHDPPTSPLDGPPSSMMGTGPYMLDYFISTAWSIVKHNDYWGGWGNPRRGFAARGYLDRVTEEFISDWPTRLAGFTGVSPIYDSIYVPRAYIGNVWQQPGVKCRYPSTTLSLDAIFFNYDTGPNSPYIGNGQWGQLGIIPTFFSDIHARKAMAYSFAWVAYIAQAWLGEAKQIPIPVPESVKFYDLTPWGYTLPPNYAGDLAKAVTEWQLAWGGQVWTNGFRFTITYNTGNVPRQTAAQILKMNIEALNPEFRVDVVEVPWPTYVRQMHSPLNNGRSLMPVFIDGWRGDFPDVHNFVGSFMGSWGYFGKAQSIYLDPWSAYIDNTIDLAFHSSTDADKAMYYNVLYQLYHNQTPSVPLAQAQCRRWERDWVQGWYYNPLFSGSDAAYIGESVKSNFYSMWKEQLPWEDLNQDGKVDIKDLATAAKAFGAYYVQPQLPPNPVGQPGYYTPNWDSRADLNIVNPTTGARCDMKVDIKDLATMAKLFGYVQPMLGDSMTNTHVGPIYTFTKTISGGVGAYTYIVTALDSTGKSVASASGITAGVATFTITFPGAGTYTVYDLAVDTQGKWGFFTQTITVTT